jgi:hypothetical protein
VCDIAILVADFSPKVALPSIFVKTFCLVFSKTISASSIGRLVDASLTIVDFSVFCENIGVENTRSKASKNCFMTKRDFNKTLIFVKNN